MDFQPNPVARPDRKYAGGVNHHFEAAAFSLSITAICCSCCLYVSLPCGALAILFAILSKGGSTKLSSKGRTALILGSAAILLTSLIFGVAAYTALQEYGSIEGILKAYSELTGIDYDTLYQQMFPQ